MTGVVFDLVDLTGPVPIDEVARQKIAGGKAVRSTTLASDKVREDVVEADVLRRRHTLSLDRQDYGVNVEKRFRWA